MPNVAESPADLIASLSGVARIEDGRLVIDDEARFRSQAAADLAWTAAFTKDDPTAEAAHWIVWEASQALGARSASIHDLYWPAAAARSPGSRSRRSTSAPRRSTWRAPSSRPRSAPTSAP